MNNWKLTIHKHGQHMEHTLKEFFWANEAINWLNTHSPKFKNLEVHLRSIKTGVAYMSFNYENR